MNNQKIAILGQKCIEEVDEFLSTVFIMPSFFLLEYMMHLSLSNCLKRPLLSVLLCIGAAAFVPMAQAESSLGGSFSKPPIPEEANAQPVPKTLTSTVELISQKNLGTFDYSTLKWGGGAYFVPERSPHDEVQIGAYRSRSSSYRAIVIELIDEKTGRVRIRPAHNTNLCLDWKTFIQKGYKRKWMEYRNCKTKGDTDWEDQTWWLVKAFPEPRWSVYVLRSASGAEGKTTHFTKSCVGLKNSAAENDALLWNCEDNYDQRWVIQSTQPAQTLPGGHRHRDEEILSQWSDLAVNFMLSTQPYTDYIKDVTRVDYEKTELTGSEQVLGGHTILPFVVSGDQVATYCQDTRRNDACVTATFTKGKSNSFAFGFTEGVDIGTKVGVDVEFLKAEHSITYKFSATQTWTNTENESIGSSVAYRVPEGGGVAWVGIGLRTIKERGAFTYSDQYGNSGKTGNFTAIVVTSDNAQTLGHCNSQQEYPRGHLCDNTWPLGAKARPVVTSVSPARVLATGGVETLTFAGHTFTRSDHIQVRRNSGTWERIDRIPTFSNAGQISITYDFASTVGDNYEFRVCSEISRCSVSQASVVVVAYPRLLSINPTSIVADNTAKTFTLSGQALPIDAAGRWDGVLQIRAEGNSSWGSLTVTDATSTTLNATFAAGNRRARYDVRVCVDSSSTICSTTVSFTAAPPDPTIATITPDRDIPANGRAQQIQIAGRSYENITTLQVMRQKGANAFQWQTVAASAPADNLGNFTLAFNLDVGNEADVIKIKVCSVNVCSNEATISTVAPLVVNSVNPSALPADGQNHTIALTGSGFTSGTIVRVTNFAGAWETIPSLFVSPTQLTATLNGGDDAFTRELIVCTSAGTDCSDSLLLEMTIPPEPPIEPGPEKPEPEEPESAPDAKPSRPTGMIVTQRMKRVIGLAWNKSRNTSYYLVHRNNLEGFRTNKPNYEDRQLTPGTSYSYYISACNSNNVCVRSSKFRVTTQDN